ncbi:Ribonuclease D [bioreactor metagenome]|jgi:ribonuclease D|uniref:3'-5' exonuclease n=1 Tax=bioreactor metagenome TaxID=1076179 RepID=A0A644ULG1_9ZZZZ|nr:3'-5' exonuclease domain-containing protein 2 [Bacteroidales bacterium]MBP9584920.1 3'-5' exonuclease domain-containing protein 2 [Bacteroidales bacterium]MBP9977726.1 3'-5' exonuclease domain-containing protein 2 [Bacteroidales bacterium]WRQ33617.1 3'-5' exonuclease [Bacteroidales bacterium MB20-C3-3]
MIFKNTISPEEIEKLKNAEFTGEVTIIDKNDESYESAIAYLASQKIIGFDTETKPVFQANVKRNSVALLQLASGTRAFIFRLTELGMPDSLCKVLSTKKIIKVGAAVNEDIRGLQRYTKFIPRGFVDLQTIGNNWLIKEKSVRKMAAIVLGVRVSKSQQLSNWEADVLSDAQVNYAAIDAWVCRQMYLKLLSTPKPENEDEKKSNT